MFRLTLKISGRVQGVGFRWFVFREAQAIGVAGYVRNCSDGSVEVVAEGSEEELDKLEAVCREGPRSSHVARVERSVESVAAASFRTFDIR